MRLSRHKLVALVSQPHQVNPLQQFLSSAQQHRRHRQVHLVHQSSTQVLSDRRHTTAHSHVFPSSRVPGPLQRRLNPFRHKMKSRPALHHKRISPRDALAQTPAHGTGAYRPTILSNFHPATVPAPAQTCSAPESTHPHSQTRVKQTARPRQVPPPSSPANGCHLVERARFEEPLVQRQSHPRPKDSPEVLIRPRPKPVQRH